MMLLIPSLVAPNGRFATVASSRGIAGADASHSTSVLSRDAPMCRHTSGYAALGTCIVRPSSLRDQSIAVFFEDSCAIARGDARPGRRGRVGRGSVLMLPLSSGVMHLLFGREEGWLVQIDMGFAESSPVATAMVAIVDTRPAACCRIVIMIMIMCRR